MQSIHKSVDAKPIIEILRTRGKLTLNTADFVIVRKTIEQWAARKIFILDYQHDQTLNITQIIVDITPSIDPRKYHEYHNLRNRQLNEDEKGE